MADFVHIDSPTPATSPPPFSTMLESHPFIQSTFLDKIYGCIIGSALGDTIGLYTEFMTKPQCENIHGDGKFQLVEPATELYPDGHRSEHFQLQEVWPTSRFAPCAWTDDTDQALLIVLSFIHNYTTSTNTKASSTTSVNPFSHATSALQSDFAHRLRIWVQQGLLALGRHPCGLGALVGSVVTNPNYLKDPVGTATERWVKSGRHVAPNGSLMRTHPIGVIGVMMSEEECWELATAVGMTTHVDPRCTVACCIEVGIIRGLLRGEITMEKDMDAAIERAYTWVRSKPALMNPSADVTLTGTDISAHLDRAEFERHIYAKSLEELDLDNPKTLGYVYKCLGSAVWLLREAMRQLSLPNNEAQSPILRSTIFEKLTVDLIMQGGDADTNGSSACALLGAYLGFANLPAHWTMGLAHKEWLMDEIYRLAIASRIVEGKIMPKEDEKAEGPRGLMSNAELEDRWAKLMAQIATRQLEAKARIRGEGMKKKGIAGWFS